METFPGKSWVRGDKATHGPCTKRLVWSRPRLGDKTGRNTRVRRTRKAGWHLGWWWVHCPNGMASARPAEAAAAPAAASAA